MHGPWCRRDRTCAWFRSRPVMPAWYRVGVIGACGRQPGTTDRAAEHGVPADRFARDRGYFEVIPCRRSPQLNARPLGGWGSVVGNPLLVT